jgi:hypothetical protein
MMKRLLSLSICITLYNVGFAQSSSTVNINVQAVKDTVVKDKVLVIPFEARMYISNADKDILDASNTDYSKMVSRFRINLALTIKQYFAKSYDAEVLMARNPDPKKDDDEKLIYRSIGYKYEALPVPTVNKSKLKSIFSSKKAKTESNSESGIVNGQLVIRPDDAPKYMSTVIENKKLLPYLTQKYGSAYFIFVNQFELNNDLSDIANNVKDGIRTLKIHYTYMDANEQRICSGIAETSFSNELNNVDEIIKQIFPAIAQKILTCVPDGTLHTIKTN